METTKDKNGPGQAVAVTMPGTALPSIEQDVAGVKRMMAGLDSLIREVLRDGEDYGIIPGTQKPTLLKPGSEKILGMLNCAVRPEVMEKIEDYDKGFFSYVVRCSAIHRGTGTDVGEGVGACNSREKRYQRQDPFQLQNTILKMAKKRAQIDCALTVGMASEKFTQDLEDGVPEDRVALELASPAQVALILSITRSHVFSDDEKDAALGFCKANPRKDKAEAFIDRLQTMVADRKKAEAQEADKDEAAQATMPDKGKGHVAQEGPRDASEPPDGSGHGPETDRAASATDGGQATESGTPADTAPGQGETGARKAPGRTQNQYVTTSDISALTRFAAQFQVDSPMLLTIAGEVCGVTALEELRKDELKAVRERVQAHRA